MTPLDGPRTPQPPPDHGAAPAPATSRAGNAHRDGRRSVDHAARSASTGGQPAAPRFVVVVKDECETCHLVLPVLHEIAHSGRDLAIVWQDDGAFLGPGLAPLAVDDRALERSFRLGIETVPTLIRMEPGMDPAAAPPPTAPGDRAPHPADERENSPDAASRTSLAPPTSPASRTSLAPPTSPAPRTNRASPTNATFPTHQASRTGTETGRAIGWIRDDWRALTGIADLGEGLPPHRPGCGSRTQEPGMRERLTVRYGETGIRARRVEAAPETDPVELCYDRGWTDGLPVVPPTPERILRMLGGTRRDPHEVVGLIPPKLAPCTIEKAAINAVMAGCRPEYLPVVLAALEAALDPGFTLHGVTCSTCHSGPVIIVNGPIARRIGMNAGLNALGQGNRANATIGRAVNLVVRNVGGGRPGEIDRATLGSPGKYTFCFAEDESDPHWEPLSVSRGVAPGRSAVTVFAGEGVQGVSDQRARRPGELTRSLAMALRAVGHPKLCEWAPAVLVISPEHYATYREAGWTRRRIADALHRELVVSGEEVIVGARGVAEGMPRSRRGERLPKFHREGLLLVRAGGPAGLFSAILSGWPGGRLLEESHPVTREIAD